ncbi:unnamed protein product [Adineta steineri]|uniref:Uncharacterized protein n=1 Tax=Adineta steineri TaxID=433720 RepID=A0A815PAN3_9BILA|nr:unnamed protein product [Adineta steineri]
MPRDIEEIFNLLGRAVGNRIAARLIFGCSRPAARSTIRALSIERDLISDACEDAIHKISGEEKENQNIMVPLLTSLSASQARNHGNQLTSNELQKALCHVAALMEMEEKKNRKTSFKKVSDNHINSANDNIYHRCFLNKIHNLYFQ